MDRRIAALAAAAVISVAPTAPAFDLGFGLFKKKTEKKTEKPDAGADKVLVATVQTDLDEAKRKSAAEALRRHDPKANFDVVSSLVAAVQKDPSPDVRATAAESLGNFKVVYQQAATALEKAETDDPDKTVRAAAKTALTQYSLAGYKPSGGKGQSAEPPLAKAPPKTPPVSPGSTVVSKPTAPEPLFRPTTQGPTNSGLALPAETDEPPLAKKPAAKPLPKPEPTRTEPKVLPIPQRMPSVIEPTVTPPKVELPAPPLPTADVSPLPLPTIPVLPPPPTVPTVKPPK